MLDYVLSATIYGRAVGEKLAHFVIGVSVMIELRTNNAIQLADFWQLNLPWG